METVGIEKLAAHDNKKQKRFQLNHTKRPIRSNWEYISLTCQHLLKCFSFQMVQDNE